MAHFLETHGIEIVVAYFLFSSIVSTMPVLPDNASYWSKWAFGALHAAAANWKQAMDNFKPNMPMVEPNSTTIKTEVKQTTVENKTEDKQ